jgi:hypothetical protein
MAGSRAVTMMSEDEFWTVVSEARAGVTGSETGADGDAEAVVARVRERLAALGRDAAVGFGLRYDELAARAYDWTLWGAAYLMKGGCSDDAFDYFQGWLVAQGRETWERAVHHPDSLAELGLDPDDDYLECEEMLSAGVAAFDDDEDYFEALATARARVPAETFTRTTTDELDFDFDDETELRARYPRLAAIYLDA